MFVTIAFVVFFLLYAIKSFFPEVNTRAYQIVMGVAALFLAIAYALGK